MAKDKTNIPAYNDMMQELFQAIKELGGSGTIKEIDDKTIEILGLSPDILAVMHGDSSKSEVEYRLAWTRTYMKKVGILENSTRGVWALTTSGRELQAINSEEIVKKVREMTSLKVKDTEKFCLEDQNLENDGVDLPDEIQTWREKLKNVLKNLKPDAFERLTQRLLRESGFTQVKVTGRTGDGGIDGMGTIKLNGIISFHMLFQCKRYVGTVSASEIRDFRGAMQGRTDKGLFITTGKFSSSAIEEANRPGTTPIDLIDGDELVEKLRELQLGVAPVNDYIIDDAWFLSI
ncbi:restriction endonuclease [Lactonifactor longoviformis]|uniref:restriction endonuclease n=1 Tax=Lactonifactor longoviformis TaxID=341220 RepID=UPI001D024A3D|nr:restriction endonuclease [Lactonifactor longoviformis]MCB5714245.1 restriction endonuclease [Lactonifactor longoviformis]MCB5718200.1 restriction endonuclease [Lactonifactor longoviformis]